MKTTKMKFKDFEFDVNPEKIKTEHSSNISQNPLFGSDSAVYNISRNASVISGEGSFWGEGAAEFSRELKRIREEPDAGWLFLPDGSCFNAFFSFLSITEEAKKDCVSYSFTFTENCNHRKSSYDFGFTYAESGENMFDVAYRSGVSIEKLMELNNFKTPFDIKEGDRVVLK